MQRLFEKLVGEFEHGRMNRRQLVTGLMAAAAGSAPAAAAEGGFKAVTVNHISYQVADYRRTRDFYVGLLGMRPEKDDGKQCYLYFGNENSHLLARNARNGGPTPRVDHIAYTIETWDKNAVEAELRRRGLEPRPDTENSFHVKDPDGFDLQISGKEMGKL
ncbi:MAG: VOC family protein [Acidobacteriia bacterium]|nr:VOC family protein [Terriglobia bacterium]